jgi:hypothetical protein
LGGEGVDLGSRGPWRYVTHPAIGGVTSMIVPGEVEACISYRGGVRHCSELKRVCVKPIGQWQSGECADKCTLGGSNCADSRLDNLGSSGGQGACGGASHWQASLDRGLHKIGRLRGSLGHLSVSGGGRRSRSGLCDREVKKRVSILS